VLGLGVPLRRTSWRRAFAGTRYLGSIAHAVPYHRIFEVLLAGAFSLTPLGSLPFANASGTLSITIP